MKAVTAGFKEALEGCESRGEVGNVLTGAEILAIIAELEAAEARSSVPSVFVMTFRNASSRLPESAETVGVYATRDLAVAELGKRRQAHLTRGSGFLVQENDGGDSITLHHEVGSMSFVPGVYSFKEHPVVRA